MPRVIRNLLLCIAIAAVLLCVLSASGYGYECFAEYRDRQRHPAPGKIVEVDGRELHLNCRDTGSPTVVIETGAGAPSLTKTLFIPRHSSRQR